MYKLRSRLINFRVTDEEFERLKAASASQGARCLSDFARSIMLGTNSAAGSFEEKLSCLEQRLLDLEANMERIRAVLASPRS